MPWPEFSELSFGFAFLREFERLYSAGGYFPAAPDFITQHKEAKLGYDVEVLINSTPVFLQFKRSFVLTTRNAREIQSGDFKDPDLFRMHLHSKNNYAQHCALQDMQKDGKSVFYITSQIGTQVALNYYYFADKLCSDAAAAFFPSDINIPNAHEEHHVTFSADEDFGYVYSDRGKRFERQYAQWDQIIENLESHRQSIDQNQKMLSELADKLMGSDPSAAQLAARFTDPVVRASVLAFTVLDAHLVFFGGAAKDAESEKAIPDDDARPR